MTKHELSISYFQYIQLQMKLLYLGINYKFPKKFEKFCFMNHPSRNIIETGISICVYSIQKSAFLKGNRYLNVTTVSNSL